MKQSTETIQDQFSDARRNFLDVRFVPEAEVDLDILNVCYRESWPSDFIAQGRQCALSRHIANLQRPGVSQGLCKPCLGSFFTSMLGIFLVSYITVPNLKINCAKNLPMT